ncbi:hypothetical protein CPB86DRAFT_191218 [Serendipita vermifera]|nr:hypothetical protein CPB86DRAFT_191218 [Serendipita vermifera]
MWRVSLLIGHDAARLRANPLTDWHSLIYNSSFLVTVPIFIVVKEFVVPERTACCSSYDLWLIKAIIKVVEVRLSIDVPCFFTSSIRV